MIMVVILHCSNNYLLNFYNNTWYISGLAKWNFNKNFDESRVGLHYVYEEVGPNGPRWPIIHMFIDK
jgi:hypothetical protein